MVAPADEDRVDSTNTPNVDAAAAETADQEVVNCTHLMAWVNEYRAMGAASFKEKKLPEAIVNYETALGAIAQTEGLPMAVDDIRIVCSAKSQLLSNIANCYFQQELYQRCVESATQSLQCDGNNPKAPYWRAKARESLKEYLLAIEDVELLGELKDKAGLSDEDRTAWIERLKNLQEVYDSTFDERLESAQDQCLRASKEIFQEIVKKHGFNSDTFADEIADYCVRPDASAEGLAAIYQIDEDEATSLMKWVEQACKMRTALNMSEQQVPLF